MGHPNLLAYAALLGWIPLILVLFALLPPRRAVVWGFLLAWLFLPMVSIPLHPFTEYNKMSAACVGVLLSALIFDSDRIFSFRMKIWDLPMLVWCLCPIASSLHNGLGLYDGLATSASQTIDWGLPYFIGRVYFNDLPSMRELARGVVIGGLLYVPLCWIEIRFSPQLHRLIYGFHQYDFGQTRRYGGFRPTVFMQHGLAVAMWMASATVASFWMWRAKTYQTLGIISAGAAFFGLIITELFCKSVGASVLMMLGIGTLIMTRLTRWPAWVLVLALLPSIYMVTRTADMWSGQDLVRWIAQHDPRGAGSLGSRLISERIFIRKALKQPWFGWGGWNRFREQDEQGRDMGVPDAMWIIAFGHNGILGLVSLTAALTLPLLLLAWKIPVRYWVHPGAAPAAALAILIILHLYDNLQNAMINPIFILGAGGLMGLNFSMRQSVVRGKPRPGQSQTIAGAGPVDPAAAPTGAAPLPMPGSM